VTYTVGPCAAADMCRAWDPIGQQPATAEGHLLCEVCLRVAEQAVRALPYDWRDLEGLIPPGARVWDGQPHSRGEPPVPINTHVEALQRAVWWAAEAWEDVVREHARLADPPRRRPGPPVTRWQVEPDGTTQVVAVDGRLEHPSALGRKLRPGLADVVRACRALAPRMALLADLPGPFPMCDYPLAAFMKADLAEEETTRYRAITVSQRTGWQGVLDLTRLHQRSVATLGLTRPVRRLPGTCPDKACGRADLRQDPPVMFRDEQPVYCGWCAATMTYDDYARANDLAGLAGRR
jgi:hypothetical protein